MGRITERLLGPARARTAVAPWTLAALTLGAIVAGGCSSSGGSTGPAQLAPGTLWVANSSAVVAYTGGQLAASTNAAPVSSLGTGTDNVGVTFDAHGNLWVPDLNSNTVAEYTPRQLSAGGSPTPAVTLSANAGSIYHPEGVAFDGDGNMWVANVGNLPRMRGAVRNSTIVEITASQLAATGPARDSSARGMAWDPLRGSGRHGRRIAGPGPVGCYAWDGVWRAADGLDVVRWRSGGANTGGTRCKLAASAPSSRVGADSRPRRIGVGYVTRAFARFTPGGAARPSGTRGPSSV